MKLFDAIDLFRKGSEVANKEAWKNAGTAAPLVTAAIMAAVKVAGDFGYGVQLSVEDASVIATGVSTLIVWIIHQISSKDAGILPAKPVPENLDDADAQVRKLM